MIFCCGNGDRADRLGVGEDGDSHLCKQLGGDGAGSDTADRLASGGASAAAVVTESIFAVKGKVSMSGTVAGSDVPVISGSLILIADDH